MAADQSECIRIDFCDELLSPSELCQRWSRSNKIPVRGQKEFLSNNSVQQKAYLQKTLEQHWMLVTEERVERVGNLVNAEWLPVEKLVKLQSPAGKFWQTMGFSDHGKQCLFPEEALYLMECGILQVFYQDLPLSIQEGYENFLSAETVTFLQYQVFGHLKRLGYVVNRFDARMRNRKSTASPAISSGQHEGGNKTSDSYINLEAPAQLQTQQAFQDETFKSDTETDRPLGRNWWTNISNQSHPDSYQSTVRHWDFSCISFPDVGSYKGKFACLPPPDPKLLPGALQLPECHMAQWHRRINLKKECQSKQDWQRKQYRCNNNDQRVCRCRNWVEHLELMEKRRGQQHNERPTSLREQEVIPLSQTGSWSSHRELLEEISIIQSYDLLEENSLRLHDSDQWRINFSVYQPDTVFKKSYPGKPYTHLCVCSFDGPVPDLHVLKQLSCQSGDVHVTFAVVDHGDISFYCFKEFKLPTDVY